MKTSSRTRRASKFYYFGNNSQQTVPKGERRVALLLRFKQDHFKLFHTIGVRTTEFHIFRSRTFPLGLSQKIGSADLTTSDPTKEVK